MASAPDVMSKIYPKGVKRQLQRLNSITTGPASIRIPENVSAIRLSFNSRVGEPAYGAKTFWRQHLPPIQFYNPQLAISVIRTNDQSKPSIEFDFVDGKQKSVDIYGKTPESILDLIITELSAESIKEADQIRLGEDL